MSRRIDRAFARYRDHGDPLALARVFDLAAGELYRLAWHLCGDRHVAEDLVQTTFLVAIEDARGPAPQRAVLPWLCGVLTNRARMRWRRQRVEQQAAATLPPAPPAADDPVERVALRELSDVARARLHALPQPYRQVCVLHLEQGLAPHEIASATARPDATVRSQLQRGLDMLRRALPLAFGVAARAAMPAPDLPAMRARVLAQAKAPSAAVAASGTPLGALLAGLCAALALVAAGVWWWTAALPGLPVESGAVVTQAGEAGSAALAAAAKAPSPQRELAPVAQAAEVGAELLVRVVYASDGAAAAGAGVRFVPQRDDGQLWEREVHADEHGVARFCAPLSGLAQLFADRGGAVEVDVRRGGVTRVDLVVPQGITVRGMVCDGESVPVVGASVWLSHAERDPRTGGVLTTTGADGSFLLRDVTPGRLLAVWSEAMSASVFEVVPALEQGEFAPQFVLTTSGAGSLRGVVRDERGAPIANAKLQLGEALAPWRYGDAPRGLPGRNTSSDERGGFVFVGIRPDPELVWQLRVCAPTRALVHMPVVIDGPATLHVILPPEARLVGTARSADGEAAWRGEVEIAVAELLHRRQFLPRWAQLSAAPGRDGRFCIGNVPAGHLGARAADGVDIANAEFDFRAGDERHWDAVLRERMIVGEVVDERGRPAGGVSVAAVNAAFPDVPPTQTDRSGKFRIDGLDAAVYELVVGNDPFDGLVRMAGVVPNTTPLRITLPASYLPNARIGLRIDAAGGAAPPVVRLRRIRQSGPPDMLEVRNIGDQFLSPRLRAGTYQVGVFVFGLGRRELGPVTLAVDQMLELPPVRFVTPGALAIELDGFEAAGRLVRVGLANGAENDCDFVVVPARRQTLPGLQPGTYWLEVEDYALCGAAVQVESGQTTVVRLNLPKERLLRVVLPEVVSPTMTWVWLDGRGQFAGQWRQRDLSQRRESDAGPSEMRVAPGSYSVEAHDARGLLARMVVDVTEQTQEIRLPGAPRPH